MQRTDGPQELRSLGETELANGVATMSDSDQYGKSRVAAAIIGSVDFRLKARAGEILKAHVAAAGGRLRGVRTSFPADKNVNITSMLPADVLANAGYREGFAQLERLGLQSEVWCLGCHGSHPPLCIVISRPRTHASYRRHGLPRNARRPASCNTSRRSRSASIAVACSIRCTIS